ncbi:MAG TPA: alpha/beta fold hydrolase [Stellaceae bacterium]|jgi:pimeloyl-ACP methyl ester carboxylesterase|nr:alpha/beta fold hydrolase [Stellaceae bacterium]
MKSVTTATLEVAYQETGPASGRPVILLHGFPDDIHAYDEVVPPLAEAGYRVIVPYLRGYGPTRFRDPAALRSGQQGALGADLLQLMDALAIERAWLAGYDWGGRAACVVSRRWRRRSRNSRSALTRLAARATLSRDAGEGIPNPIPSPASRERGVTTAEPGITG